MAGAWELKAAKSVLAYILHTETTTVAWSFGLRNLIVPGDIMPVAGMPFDHARNAAAQHCLANGYEWLFSLDSDVIPPRDAIVRLIARQKPIISGLYARRSPPHGLPVMMRDGVGWVTDYQPGSVIEVDLVGAGCLLIHRTVLERLKPQRPEAGKHWFDWRVDMREMRGLPAHLPPLSEDYTFCKAAKAQLGIPTLVDTSVKCRHIGYAEAEHGSFKPLEVHPVT